MENFCRVCGSILRWDFSTGDRARICSRCGRVDLLEEPGDPKETTKLDSSGKKGANSRFKVRKGVSPRSSKYASRSLFDSETSTITSKDLSSMKEQSRVDKKGKKTGKDWTEAGRMFPFDRIRPGQDDFLNDVKKTISSGGFLLANVPTGIGKTAAALSPAIEHALERGTMVLFMTSKQSQHAIAIDTIKKLTRRSNSRIKAVDIISKQSMCPRDISRLPHSTFSFLCKQQSKDGSCPLYKQPPPSLIREILEDVNDVNSTVELSLQRKVCPHRAALEAAKETNVLICDFNYLFSDLKDTVLSGLSKDISEITIIVDEAHNLPDRIRAHQSSELLVRILDEAIDLCTGRKHLKHHLRIIRDLIISMAKKELGDKGEIELDKRLFVSEIRAIFQESTDRQVHGPGYVHRNAGGPFKEKGERGRG